MRGIASLLSAFLILACPAPVVAADWLYGAEAGIVRIDNLPRARLAADGRTDTVVEMDFRAERLLNIRAPGVFFVYTELGLDQYQEYSSLNQRRGALGLVYRHRLGLGHAAPWWSVDATLGYDDHNHSARDGARFRIGLSGGRALSERFDVRGTVEYEQRNGNGGATGLNPQRVHDLSGWTARADIDYRFGSRFGAFVGLAVRHGHINTSTTQPGMIVGTWADDPTFGAGWRTYRVNARVVTLTLGGQMELGSSTVIQVSWDRLDGRARTTGFDYDTSWIQLRVRHDF